MCSELIYAIHKMAYNKRRSGRGFGQRGRAVDQRRGAGPDSSNWRDHSEPAPRPQPISPSQPTTHEKCVEYLSKEWADVEKLHSAGQAKKFSPGSDWSIKALPEQPMDLQSWLEEHRTSEANM